MHWATLLSFFLLLSGLSLNVGVGATRQHVFGTGKLPTSPSGRPAAPAFQIPKVQSYNAYAETYDSGLFTPFESLSALSSSNYASLTHPFYPRHSVRIKKSTFCDGSVNSYTGYIDVDARHLFFYFFESRRDPAKDDMIFWTNGGPGCSSAMGLFMELGPCRIVQEAAKDGGDDAEIKLKYHPQSWNEFANVFFVDQPVGVGFSYAEHGESVVSRFRFVLFRAVIIGFRALRKRQRKISLRSSASFSNISTRSKGGLSTWPVNHTVFVSVKL